MAQAPRLLALPLRALCTSGSRLLAVEASGTLARGRAFARSTWSSASSSVLASSLLLTPTAATTTLSPHLSHRLAPATFCLSTLRCISSTSKVGCSRGGRLKMRREEPEKGGRGKPHLLRKGAPMGGRKKRSREREPLTSLVEKRRKKSPHPFSFSLSPSLPQTARGSISIIIIISSSGTSLLLLLLLCRSGRSPRC